MEIQKSSPENTIAKSQKCKRCDKDAVFKCAHPDCIQMVRQILCEICDKNCHNGLTIRTIKENGWVDYFLKIL